MSPSHNRKRTDWNHQQALERAAEFMVRMQSARASQDPRYIEATSKAVNGAVLTPDTEARVWYDNLGELALANATLDDLLRTVGFGVTVRERRIDEHRLTVTWELSNGSAIVIGLKAFEHRSKA